jgi:hypothetical protein
MKVLSGSEQETKAYKRLLDVEVKGVVYSVTLYWDEWEGYQTSWRKDGEQVLAPQQIVDEAERECVSVGYLLEEMEGASL